MENCIFCKIVAGDIPSHKVYEDDKVLAFLDIHPTHLGHTLIVPKAHYIWIQDTPDDVLTYSFLKAKNLMVKMKEKLGVDYVQVSIVGKDVPHFHIHLMPRMLNDHQENTNKDLDKNDFEKVLEKMR